MTSMDGDNASKYGDKSVKSRRPPMRSTNSPSALSAHSEYTVNGDRDILLHEMETPPNWRKDAQSIILLIFLYVLQGIPLGLAGSVPLLLQKQGASYSEQALFSLVYWPFSLKLVWAPFVDSLYYKALGRRKTWLIPTQYLIGITMLILSKFVGAWIGDDEGKSADFTPAVHMLTAAFLFLYFLAATQDIAVDGWALTMLSKENVSYASTCNCIGQTAGYFLGYVVFLALASEDFCNNYLRTVKSDQGLVTLADFLFFWGCVFMLTTTLVWVFKSEPAERKPSGVRATQGEQECDSGLGAVWETYKQLWSIMQLPSVRWLAAIFISCKLGFAAADAVTGLKLLEAGLLKDQAALLVVPLVPLQIVLPLIISKYTNGPRPMNVFLRAMPYRLMFGVVFAVIVWVTPAMKLPGQPGSTHAQFSPLFYASLLVIYGLHQITVYSMFVAAMAFFARVSDPLIGGTYMTLLNTICNLGGNWPSTVALYFVDTLTTKLCVPATDEARTANATLIADNTCNNVISKQLCAGFGGVCETQIDGYYVESAICIVLGLIWLPWGRSCLRRLQELPLDQWKVSAALPDSKRTR